MRIRKTYSFAWKSAFIITIFSLFLSFLGLSFTGTELPIYIIILYTIFLFILTFVVIQYRVEKFIYQRVKKIYQNVSLLDVKELKKTTITSDMETLSKEVQKFADDKLLEIASLNEQASFRREFMGNVAHELKTPLFSIQGYLLTLLDGGVSEKKVLKKYLKRAEKNVDRLVNIVEDLDFISRMDAKNVVLNMQEFDIVLLTQTIFEMLEIKAQKYHIQLSFFKSFPRILVYADKKRIEQVMINLLTNSIKYGVKGGISRVNFSVDENVKKVKICIIDSGEGIAKEHLSRLFERFYRVDSGRSRAEGGSGLGLSIVKHIVELHNQKVSVKSKLGEGSSFCFGLALAD
jgi:two-component system phosphate regulon sensor histidine kinase PhoR